MTKKLKEKDKLFRKRICDSLEGDKDGEFRILGCPNFYFPMMQRGEKFTVLNTYNLPLNDEKLIKEYKTYKEMQKKYDKIDIGTLTIYSKIFWKVIIDNKLDEEYADCWLCPIRITEFGDDLEVDIDILKPVK